MSDEDVRMLDVCCEKTGLTKAAVIRKGIKELYERLTQK